MRKSQSITVLFCCIFISILTHFGQAQNPGNIRIDHLTIAVNDLEQAKKDFKALGFTIKPGRLHANSIKNAHIKFQDGTALELITATDPKDQLAERYLKLMAKGDGPAFLCLGTDDPESTLESLLDFDAMMSDGSYYQWVTFPDNSALSYLYFQKYTNPPVDLKEQLQHENGVMGIKSISLEKPDFSHELSMFLALKADSDPANTEVALGNQSLILESKKNGISPAPPIVSITLLVQDIHETLERLPKGIPFHITSASRVILPVEYCHGIQIILEQKP